MDEDIRRDEELLRRLEKAHVVLIEWESTLLIRLGVPLAKDGSVFFLVPDEQLQTVRDVAASMGAYPADEKQMALAYPCEHAPGALRYYIPQPKGSLRAGADQRLVFIPLSWSGLHMDEVFPLASDAPEIQFTPRTPRLNGPYNLPGFVYTVPIAATIATQMRIASRAPRRGKIYNGIRLDMANIVGYGLFDMSYEGDYMECLTDDVPRSPEELEEMRLAVETIRGWTFRKDEEWMRTLLLEILAAKKTYDDLPWQSNVLQTISSNV